MATTEIRIERGMVREGLRHLVADVADAVVAEEIVHRQRHGRAEPQQEPAGEAEGPGREGKGGFGVEVPQAGDQHHRDGQHHPDP